MKLFGDSIKAKVVVGFGLALSLVVFAIYLTYASFTQLLHSVDVLSEPNRKLNSLQHTLATISAAESSIRAYTLTTKQEHFKEYINHLDSIEGQLDTLQALMKYSPGELAQVDSIATLLQAKQESLQNFIALKKEQKSLDLPGKAMRQIASSAEEKPLSTTIKQHTTTTISDRLTLKNNGDSEEPARAQEQPKEEKKGFFSKLFSRKDKDEKQPEAPPEVIIPEINVTREVEVDTNRITSPVAPLAKVRRILHNVQREAEQKAEQLQAKELALLQQDKHIMDQIRSMMYELERNELEKSIENSARARVVAKDTSMVLLLVGIGGLGGGIAFILLILRDITRSNNYRSKLIKAQKEAVQLARAKEAFVANMSHEMRTPLNVILGFTQQLHHTPLKIQQQEHVQAINGAGQHLLHIVNDVLDLSKIEAGKLSINSTSFSMQELLVEVKQAFSLKASSKSIDFRCHLGDAMPDALQGDALRIKQILFNLIDNAIKFTHQGQVSVDVNLLSQRRSRVVTSITVSDTGIGIPQNKVQHIFGEFNQADNTILRKYGGTGLGLSISKKLVEMQGGTLSVKSEQGTGTTFTIVLPLLKATASTVATVKAAPVTKSFHGFSALVIDDDAYSRTLGELMLSRWGMQVYLANDGQEALELVKKNKFDVVLTDIQLPGVSGKTVARAIRKHDKEVPILAVTANILSNDPDFFKGSAIAGYLLKPFTEMELHLKLQEVLPTSGPPVTEVPEPEHDAQQGGLCSDSSELYSLSEMRAFTGDDNATLAAVLEVLLNDQKQNLLQLKAAAAEVNWVAAANVAHKMLTAFKHLQAHTVTPGLQQLEQVLHVPEIETKELPAVAADILIKANKVLIELQQEQTQLKELAAQPTV
ncbi:ATP-binding protein [Pontibacter sp. MBLB2868]|uniref:ATP-binding protein n=1 Tax=Pontibacter sp. MBLB2868 TaxID=3451555 RepID=UPI003F74F144